MNLEVAIYFKYRHCVIRVDGTVVLKYLLDARLTIFLIKFVNVVRRRDGVW